MEFELDSTQATFIDAKIPYADEVHEIRARLGSLESVRENLGLTKKQMAELLLVDPSAWTRWTRDGESAPAHVYRALDWYCQIIAETPLKGAHDHLAQVERRMRRYHSDLLQRIHDLERAPKVSTVSQVETGDALTSGWKFLSVLNLILVLALLVFQAFSK